MLLNMIYIKNNYYKNKTNYFQKIKKVNMFSKKKNKYKIK